jgi:hypothetical protein
MAFWNVDNSLFPGWVSLQVNLPSSNYDFPSETISLTNQKWGRQLLPMDNSEYAFLTTVDNNLFGSRVSQFSHRAWKPFSQADSSYYSVAMCKKEKVSDIMVAVMFRKFDSPPTIFHKLAVYSVKKDNTGCSINGFANRCLNCRYFGDILKGNGACSAQTCPENN